MNRNKTESNPEQPGREQIKETHKCTVILHRIPNETSSHHLLWGSSRPET